MFNAQNVFTTFLFNALNKVSGDRYLAPHFREFVGARYLSPDTEPPNIFKKMLEFNYFAYICSDKTI